MDNLSYDAREILIQAGWKPINEVDLTETVKFLEAMGYQVFDSVIDALSVFGGVEYKFKHPDGSLETFIFSPEEAVGDYYEKEDFEEFEARVKEPLVVVGEAYRGNLIMFISKSGKVYGKNGYSLFKFGDNIFEALDTLCLFRKPEEVE
ncbi:SUKH-3 domain-containing protein [Paenibacillus polymyxa]|uniref:SUKH-3 domain-containing protein n=1 Tax=Paenibacillus polymyxa TaxID=1406 RepID=UPI002AB4FD0A|nr:SUKH-3 domain-containing protein [Paenibacillus polymyxa]MDY8024486.1 SUKH-3 domain-containing protein [Paenibacillus polymyxa]